MSVTRATGAGAGTATTATNSQRKLGRDIGKLSNRRVSASPPLPKRAAGPPPGSESLRTRSTFAEETKPESRFQMEAHMLHEATKDLSQAISQENASKELEELKINLQNFETTISKIERNPTQDTAFKGSVIKQITTRLFKRLENTRGSAGRSDTETKSLNLLRKIATFRERHPDRFPRKAMFESTPLTKKIKQFFQQQNIRF